MLTDNLKMMKLKCRDGCIELIALQDKICFLILKVRIIIYSLSWIQSKNF